MTGRAPLSGLRRLITQPAPRPADGDPWPATARPGPIAGGPGPIAGGPGPIAGGPSPIAGDSRPEHAGQRCELCSEPIAPEHRHLVDVDARTLRCACRACALLFDRPAGGARYRLVPDRRWHLPDFRLDDAAWADLGIPVDMAFFFRDSAAGRVVAFYPSPAGAVESLLDLATWTRLEAANPVLGRLAPDVEALLVHRTPDAADHWLVPVDDCYALVGLIRSRWSGLAGGPAVWDGIATFFADLRARARPLPAGTDGTVTGPDGTRGMDETSGDERRSQA